MAREATIGEIRSGESRDADAMKENHTGKQTATLSLASTPQRTAPREEKSGNNPFTDSPVSPCGRLRAATPTT